MRARHLIVIGDSRRMEAVSDESVHLVITSPPYWQLKDYGDPRQIGFDDSYEDYVNNLNLVWKECHRVLHKGCRLCVNIGDQFARSVYYGRYKVIPIRTEIIRFCETVGFDYMGAVIWQKVTTCNTTGGASIMGSFPHPRNGILKIDYEFILIFKKHGKAPKVSQEMKEQSRLSTEEWKKYFAGHWNFPGEKQSGHLAMFPEELPRRLIRMFSFAGETVLDPFLGSGTTSLAASRLGRNSIGYEVNEAFLPLIKEKLGLAKGSMFGDFQISRQESRTIDPAAAVKELPYLFRDPLILDRKVNPKRLNFGSRIDRKSRARAQYHKVKQVLSPELVVLDSGLVVRLIGIKENPAKRNKAVSFLEQKTSGQRVFMKYDREKHDQDGHLLCYLYLENRTFINAHLLKQGLADVDTAIDYQHRDRFLSYGKAE